MPDLFCPQSAGWCLSVAVSFRWDVVLAALDYAAAHEGSSFAHALETTAELMAASPSLRLEHRTLRAISRERGLA